jgi:hypothetical protein
VPDSHDVPTGIAPGGAETPALPDGMEALPDWGPDAIGTRFRDGALTFYRMLSVVLALLAIGTAALFFTSFSVSAASVVIALVLVALLALSAVNYHRIAGHGVARPAVVISAGVLEVLVPFNRLSVDLAAIRDVTVLSRDLVVLAPGGIRHGERPSRAKRAVINNVRSFAVERAQLAKVINERARKVNG